MNFKANNAKNLIEVHIRKAEQRLKSAETLLDIGNYEDAVSRAYYAILDAATACLVKKDVIPQSHAGAIRLFSLHYIKPGTVDKKHQRQFARIEKARIEADYTHLRIFSREETAEIIASAHEFVKMAKALVE
ncbi:MAG: HEPN domain-containing protein [Pseudomonadota bacterium]